ncbi:hypothetical protein HK105_201835 [Polyrhizophydium stewartii]|uniref:Seipin n=1 Tax=Polyrhizophydium stewartii TaxID=2732419 RepID=A0ABR4NG53_9FUNG
MDDVGDIASDTVQTVRESVEPIWRGIVEQVTSEKTAKAAVNSVVFGAVFSAMVVAAFGAYGLFYALYMPQVATVVPFYLQYGQGRLPQASLDIVHSTFLKPDQQYNFAVDISLPDSEFNFQQGNFMVTIELVSKTNETVARASRPAMVRYKSPLFRLISTVWSLPSLLLGYGFEAHQLTVPLIESFSDKQAVQVDRALISISNKDLQTYSTTLRIQTHFQGLSYFMYHWWLSTAILFISLILLVETLFMSTLWSVLQALMSADDDEQPAKDSSNGLLDADADPDNILGTNQGVEPASDYEDADNGSTASDSSIDEADNAPGRGSGFQFGSEQEEIAAAHSYAQDMYGINPTHIGSDGRLLHRPPVDASAASPASAAQLRGGEALAGYTSPFVPSTYGSSYTPYGSPFAGGRGATGSTATSSVAVGGGIARMGGSGGTSFAAAPPPSSRLQFEVSASPSSKSPVPSTDDADSRHDDFFARGSAHSSGNDTLPATHEQFEAADGAAAVPGDESEPSLDQTTPSFAPHQADLDAMIDRTAAAISAGHEDFVDIGNSQTLSDSSASEVVAPSPTRGATE